MATTVHVILSGIVSLVPNPKDGGYLVRMQQDTREVRQQHERHFPSILAEKRRVSTQLPFAAEKPKNNAVYRAWKIENGTLEIKNAITSAPLVRALNDVLKIANACPKDKPKCVISKSKGDFEGVELAVRRGELKTIGHEPYDWYFEEHGAENASRPAEEVVWTFKILDPPLRLWILNGKNDPVPFTVDAPTGKDIEIRLQNVPYQDLIPTPEDSPPKEDAHVDLYFEHSIDPPKTRPVKLLRKNDEPQYDRLPLYRLAGRRIVEALAGPLAETASAGVPIEHTAPGMAERAGSATRRKKKIDPRVVRVNCPPAVWEGLEPPPR